MLLIYCKPLNTNIETHFLLNFSKESSSISELCNCKRKILFWEGQSNDSWFIFLCQKLKWGPEAVKLRSFYLNCTLLQADNKKGLNVVDLWHQYHSRCFGMLWRGRAYSQTVLLSLCNTCFHMQFLMWNSKYLLEVESGHFPLKRGVVRVAILCCIDCRCVTTMGTATAITDGHLLFATSQAMVAVSTVVQLT